jgi:hypothetical protein
MSFNKYGAARIDASILIVGGVPVRIEELLAVSIWEPLGICTSISGSFTNVR